MAIFFIGALRAFELERQKRMARAQEAQIAAQQETLETQRRAQSETEQLNRELREREELLEELFNKIVSAQEGERQRIARELHDGAGQILTGLGLGLAAAGESVKSDPATASTQLVELKRLNAQALEELHIVISDLRPSLLDDLGLVPALKAQTQQFETRTGVTATFTVEGRRHRLQPELETVLFRIGQEALTNAAKHANAESVSMLLIYSENCVKLVVKDDGCGFKPDAVLKPDDHQRTAWGLLGIQERVALVGGVCFIISRPGSGTTIHVTVPLMSEIENNVNN
jgi:signal transduction histidine kinase